MAHAEALLGGLRNTNYKVWLDGDKVPVVVRFYVADPTACGRDTATGRLASNKAPMPKILASDCQQDLPVAVFEWIEGARFDEMLNQADATEIEQASRSAGRTLAAIHQHSFSEMGFLDAQLGMAQQLPRGSAGWVQMLTHFLSGPSGDQLGRDLTERLRKFVSENSGRIRVESRFCLVHADFKPWNLLVRKDPEWRVVGVLDWEFAFAGAALFDLAIYLRNRDAFPPEYTAGFVAGYRDGGGGLSPTWAALTRLYDLVNLCSMLETPRDAATVGDMQGLVERTISELS